MVLDILSFIIIITIVIFFLGLCILVHEAGHLFCALWRGLHVERFSIGFGKKIWGFERNGVEYQIGWLPFGGYVALPQLEPVEEPKTESGETLPQAKPFDRMLTALSGPVSNILLGFVLGSLVWLVGVERPKPAEQLKVYKVQEYIQPEAEGEEREKTPEYKAGLRAGDVITEINDKEVSGEWWNLVKTIILSTDKIELTLQRGDDEKTIRYKPKANPDPEIKSLEGKAYPFFKVRTPVVIQRLLPESPAAEAGLAEGDQILKVNNNEVFNTRHFIETLAEAEDQPVSITVERDDETMEFSGIRGEPKKEEDKTVYHIGVKVGAPLIVRHFSPWWQLKNVITTSVDTLRSVVSSDSLIGPQDLSGPVGILKAQYDTIRYSGWIEGLFFVVFVTFSLAFLNLLPIPVLDGGHIVIGALEMVFRRRIPEKAAMYIQMFFAVLLIGFMLFVTFHDIFRLYKFGF